MVKLEELAKSIPTDRATEAAEYLKWASGLIEKKPDFRLTRITSIAPFLSDEERKKLIIMLEIIGAADVNPKKSPHVHPKEHIPGVR